jgi:BirA family biotin operon repressor/biotin-[acetyl-CoA-carboxylase] ligase
VISLVNPELIYECVKKLTLNPQVVCLPTVDSTSDEAKRRIASGQHDELLILADTQTHGRGRHNRTWYSPAGGLYLSLTLRPIFDSDSIPLHNFLCACAVAKALQNMGIERVGLKWPNDVLIAEHKVAGILSELISLGPDEFLIVLGIGINQNTPLNLLPEDIRYSTTSVLEHLGRVTSLEELLCDVLTSIDFWLQTARSSGSFDLVLDEWRQKSATLGSRVRVDDGSRTYIGVAKEILSDGSLLVQTEDGDITFCIGDLTHLRQD